ncbi:hypothetical protein [Streptomyces antibioticus]
MTLVIDAMHAAPVEAEADAEAEADVAVPESADAAWWPATARPPVTAGPPVTTRARHRGMVLFSWFPVIPGT